MDLFRDATPLGLPSVGQPRLDFGTVVSTAWLGEQWEVLEYLLAKQMLDVHVVERASKKSLNRQRTIAFALPKRQSSSQPRPQQDFRDM